MVVTRLTADLIDAHWAALQRLVERVAPDERGVPYLQLLRHAPENPHILAIGVFQDEYLVGLALLLAGLSYTGALIAAHWLLLVLDRGVRFRAVYPAMNALIEDWCRTHGIRVILGSSPRHGFPRLMQQIDPRFRVVPVLVREVQ
jgi:hypothetical protein